MDARDLHNALADKINSGGSLLRFCDDFKQYQLAHCYHPKKISVWNPHLGQFELREVPCGKCYHCQETKVNSWVTRCYAHAEDFKNVYFVTLTYEGLYLSPREVASSSLSSKRPFERFLLSYLQDALWHYDNFNKYNKRCWSPCVLCKSHYQNFLKRLRKNTGLTDLTYFCCGEYGHDFGRPHFHLILFTNGVLTERDIISAWGLRLKLTSDGRVRIKSSDYVDETCKFMPFGRVSFDNLVENGTMNTNGVLVDGVEHSAHHCFAYVCKYMCKSAFTDSRIKLAFDSLYEYGAKPEYWDIPDLKDPDASCIPNPYYGALQSMSNYNQLDDTIYHDIYPLKQSDYFYYGSVQFYASDDNGAPDWTSPLFPVCLNEFRHRFRPFTSPSRGTPIGSIYVRTHLQELVSGIPCKPTLQSVGFVSPDYFKRKAQEYVFGLVQKSADNSFSKGNLGLLFEDLSYLAEGTERCSRIHFVGEDTPIREVLNGPYCFRDAHSGLRYLFVHSNFLSRVDAFRYDRKLRDYVLVSSESPVDFASRWLAQLKESYRIYYETRQKALERDEYIKSIESKIIDLFAQDWTLFARSIVEQIEYDNIQYFKMKDSAKTYFD